MSKSRWRYSVLAWKAYTYGVVCSLNERDLVGGKVGLHLSASIRDLNFGVILHAILGVQGTSKKCLGFSMPDGGVSVVERCT